MDKSYKELLGNRPIGFTRESIELLKKEYYSVSHKIDGEHRFVKITNNMISLLDVNNNLTEFEKFEHTQNIICEAEFCPEQKTVYLFDLLYLDKDITNLSFAQRYKLLSKIKFPPELLVKKFYFPKSKSRISHYCKTLLREKTVYGVDGIIFMPCTKPYYEPQNILKWKPPSMLTVDFLVKNNIVYCAMNKKQFLERQLHRHNDFKNIRVSNYFPIEFKADYFGLTGETHLLDNSELITHNKIVECIYDHSILKWKPLKIRLDKTESYENSKAFCGPNNITTSLSIYRESQDPITEEQITHLVLE